MSYEILVASLALGGVIGLIIRARQLSRTVIELREFASLQLRINMMVAKRINKEEDNVD